MMRDEAVQLIAAALEGRGKTTDTNRGRPGAAWAPAAVRSDGATDGGSHEPSRVEPPVVAMKKSIPGKTPKEAVSEKSGSSSGDNGFRGLLELRFGADDTLGENIVLSWTQMDVYF